VVATTESMDFSVYYYLNAFWGVFNLTPCPSPPWGGEDACTIPIVIKQFIRNIKIYWQRKNVAWRHLFSQRWGGEDAYTLPIVIKEFFRIIKVYR